MNVGIGNEAGRAVSFWEYLFQIFGTVTLQCILRRCMVVHCTVIIGNIVKTMVENTIVSQMVGILLKGQ
jgi:hypothetical protein